MPDPSLSRAVAWQSPWFWSTAGVFATALTAVWLTLAPDLFEYARWGLVWAGLVAGGAGAALQFRQAEQERPPRAKSFTRLILILAYTSMAIGVTTNVVASWAGIYFLGLRPGLATILWLLAGPLNALAAWQALRQWPARAPIRHNDRSAMCLLITSATAFLGCFALSSADPDFVTGWFTMQRFLLIMGGVALFTSPLIGVDAATRRSVISGLAVFHLGGIVIAALSHDPSPWVIDQIWGRIYRPYLQFLYLTNAYHFYSPEPGPPSHLWFYLYFSDAQGEMKGHWYKIPRIDENGRHHHTTSLEYQRHLSITEHTMGSSPVQIEGAEFQNRLKRRVAWTPEAAQNDPLLVLDPTKREVAIPLNPNKTKLQQFYNPRQDNKRVLISYSRHVLHKHAAEYPERKYVSVRIYRVIHRIPSMESYFGGWNPSDPEFFTPIYMGEFDAGGKLLDPNEPFLYWELPILRDNPNVFESTIKDWARRHAGDPYWRRVMQPGDTALWVDDKGNPPPLN